MNSTKQPCIRIHGRTRDGEKFRPGTPSPDLHWTSRLAHEFLTWPGILIAGGEEGPELQLFKEFWQQGPESEAAFEHIMRFVKLNDLDYAVERSECLTCREHESCVSAKPDDHKWTIPKYSDAT